MRYFPITLMAVLTSSLFVALVINPVLTSYLMKVDEEADTTEERRKRIKNVFIGALAMTAIAFFGHFSGKEWVRNLFGIAVIISLINFFIFRPGTFFFQNRGLPFLEKGYKSFLNGVLSGVGPYMTFGGTILLLIGSMMLFGMFTPKIEYFPTGDPQYVNVFVDLPLGSDIELSLIHI